ncbi:methyltransferase family protein [Mycobacterium genavense]|uniref:methyltransferase family protein n=1 Tax=Mycobacterium genavense TaxID=36812 RepID=UPI00055FA1DC|nr:isoprenylcysteine carboxylmethyltransferase family protein [Mycobacterium genavense]
MRTSAASVGSAAFFVVAPGTVIGVIPWLITGWVLPNGGVLLRWAQAAGVVLIVAGLIPLIHAFAQFARAGGTPAPVAPTEHLVVTGFNRYVRNPMYVGLVLVILGQALLFRSPGLLAYAAIVWIAFATFVLLYEQPTLTRQYGDEYEEYKLNVPAWLPRLRPW